MFRHHPSLYLLLIGSLAAFGCSKESSGKTQDNQAATPAATDQAGAAKVQPAAKPTKADGTVYGGGLSDIETVAISKVMADPQAYSGKTVRVEGMVTDVCPKRGCWFQMAGDQPGQKMKFKVKDGVMEFPLDAKGKYAVAEGVVTTRTLTLEETRKYLEYEKKEYGKDVDPETVTEPMTIVQLAGKGAVIRDSK